MKNKYTLQITPLGFFFFGGENTFNVGHDNAKANYFAKSTYFPQQTALLGMIRHLLLMYNTPCLLEKEAYEKSEKIGGQSFDIGYDASYGIIDTLSPIFIIENVEKDKFHHWIPAGFDFQVYDKSRKFIEPNKKKGIKIVTDVVHDFIDLDKFDYKEDCKLCLKCIETDEWCTIESFYDPLFKVGVKKNNKENDDDKEAFYKQALLRLKKQFSFGVNIKLVVEKEKKVPDEMLMMFGADQSEFKVEWKKWRDIFYDEKENENLFSKVTLLSDAYVDESIWPLCKFSFNQSQDFRYIISKTIFQNYYNIGAASEAKKRNAKLNLLSKGSVLYTDKPKEVTNLLKGEADAAINVKSFRRIGYNHFKVQKIN